MIESTYLGNNGLTITSANHIANIAKEMYEAIENQLSSLKLYNRDYMLAVNGNTYRVENESDKAELEGLFENLKKIGELKSLIAFLREGIKAKDALESDNAFDEHVETMILNGRKDLRRPSLTSETTFENEFEKLSSEQKAKYFTLQSKCATLGAYIHPKGTFAEARKSFFASKKNPTQIEGRGQQAEISTFTSGFSAEEVDKTFFTLQKEYRSLQAELNKMKGEIDAKVAESNKNLALESLGKHKLWAEALKVEKLKYEDEVKALKVVIPQNLRDIYEKVSNVANEK